MIEFEEILDDWHLLKKSSRKTRKPYGEKVQTMYIPLHVRQDSHSPLWWRQFGLKQQWAGVVYDEDPMDGSALLGLGSIKGITYVCYFSNSRHKEIWERVGRIFNIDLQILAKPDFPKQGVHIRRFLVE